jgi:hypothetical protein
MAEVRRKAIGQEDRLVFECRRTSPVWHYSQAQFNQGGFKVHGWPVVGRDDWCGEGRLRLPEKHEETGGGC